jgi:hypothetical protein
MAAVEGSKKLKTKEQIPLQHGTKRGETMRALVRRGDRARSQLLRRVFEVFIADGPCLDEQAH